MKEKLRNMYEEGLLDTTGLLNAVAKDWITITDVIEIVGEDNALSVVMSAKLSEISNACNAVIVNGVDIKFGEETVHFNLSIEDQSNINNLFRVVELGGTEYPYQPMAAFVVFIPQPKLQLSILRHRRLSQLRLPT